MAQPGLALLGAVLLAWSWLGPLPVTANHSFAAHMTLHMLVVALGTPLVAVGLAGTRFDGVRYRPELFPPVLASLVEMLLVWLWHAPAFHHWARHTRTGFIIEQLSFALAGWWLWQAAFGEPAGPALQEVTAAGSNSNEASQPGLSERKGAGVLALLLTSMHMTLLGALIALSPRQLFHHGHAGPVEEQLADQHLGGAIMLVVGGIAYLCGGLILLGHVVNDQRTTVREGGYK